MESRQMASSNAPARPYRSPCRLPSLTFRGCERSLAPRLGRFVAGLLVAETWLPGEAVRTWFTHSVVLTIVEMFYVRGVVTPFFQYAPFPSGGSMLPPRVCPPLPGLPGAYPVYRPMVWRWL